MAFFSYPERGGHREQSVVGGKVTREVEERVMAELIFADNNPIAFKKGVSFVRG